MKISFTTVNENLQTSNGYGIAGYSIVTSLQKLGHTVPFKDPSAEVEFGFVQPDRVEWSNPNAYHILLTPFESDIIPREWDRGIRSANEFWTTSDQCKQWFEDAGYKVDKIYPHGVSHEWTPLLRKQRGVTKFLHVGEPAPRKLGQAAFDAFVDAFGDREDVRLTIKGHTMSTVRGKNNVLPQNAQKNVNVITTELQDEEMINLFHSHDVLVYPSAGEGFGMIPLQAMATGMPVMCIPDWAHYKDLLIPDLKISSIKIQSPWQHMHPGKAYWPNTGSLSNIMQKVQANYNYYAQIAYQIAPVVHKKYDWIKLTEQAFANVTSM